MPKTSHNRREVMTVKEVSDYLEVHPRTVYNYAKAGKIPAFKIGSDWRFYKVSIKRWIHDKENFNSEKKERRGQGELFKQEEK
jgi:excisionase family DNA binding protein